MQFDGAVVRKQGVTFAVVVVKKHIIDNKGEAQKTARGFSSAFPGLPIVLMGQDSYGTPTYFGRRDIAGFLASISPALIPWKRYKLN